MDTDDSSSEEQSSSECSTESSDDDEKLETAQICGVKLQLPQGLCERKDVFDEFFSAHTWNSLSEIHRQHLKNFLPAFPENDEHEKNVTLKMLFDNQVFRFNSPMEQFHEKLKAGHYRPDISKMKTLIKKAERRELKFRHKLYRERLKNDVVESRNRLLNVVRNLPPNVEPKMEKYGVSTTQSFVNPISFRTKRRYFQELKEVKEKVEETGFSSDENYPEGPPVSMSRKQKRHLNSIKNSTLNGERIISTFAPKSNFVDLERLVLPNSNPFSISEDFYKTILMSHKRLRLENSQTLEYNTSGVTISDVITRCDLTAFKKLATPVVSTKHHLEQKSTPAKKKIKREPPPLSINHSPPELFNKTNPFFGPSSNSDSDSDSFFDSHLKIKRKITPKPEKLPESPIPILDKPIIEDPPTTIISPPKPLNYGKIVPATISDLDGIDMMNLPIDLDDSNIDILELNNKPELMQETHANFLSLIRDIVCSTNEHRMSMKVLEERLKSWQENPISPLNDWYSMSDNWVLLLVSAVNFLSGNCLEQPEDFVPYIEYKNKIDMHQWIGAGRDSDALLSPLCQYWLEHRNQMKPSVAVKEKEEEIDMLIRSQTPPPPRCPTTWSIRKGNSEDVRIFQEQEQNRYSNPHKSFTYRCNGYESVVGPVKGVYNNQNIGSTKARGHSVLTADRPNYVTILTLVRDATARLPNGEGTRGDICELLKSSQYLSLNVPDNVLQSVVSGALDRMHTQFDPCVKYEPKRKVWIYLHRNRSEEDFERLHQQYQGMSKNPKKSITKSKPKPKNKNVKTNADGSQIQNEIKTEIKVQQNVHEMSGSEVKSVKPLTSIDLALKAQQNRKSPTKHLQKPEKAESVLLPQQNAAPALLKHPQINKSIVKVISSPHGKSLIIPTSGSQILKQIERSHTLGKQVTQTIVQKARQINSDQKTQLTKLSASLQQQIIQSAAPKLQSLKGVALLKTANSSSIPVPQTQNVTASLTLTSTLTPIKDSVVNTSVTSQPVIQEQVIQTGIQNKITQPRLTPAQQQQILQSLKQKVLPLQQTVMSSQYRTITKQKVTTAQVHKQATTTTILGQSKISLSDGVTNKPIISTNQTPLVAKVLTNAAGQVISVDSLLAHQKQHGSLPQGTTLRISGAKGGQPSVIQIGSSQNPTTQYTVTSSSLASLTNQPKLMVSTPMTSVVTSTITVVKPAIKTTPKLQTGTTTAKFPPKLAQQLVNAKFVTQNIAGQKIVQPKVIVGQANQLKVPISSKSLTLAKPVGINVTNANTIRMVNATNLNLAQLAGKPVLITSKGNTFQNLQGQNIIIQTQANSNNSGLIISNTDKTNASIAQISSAGATIGNQQSAQVILSPSLKMQQSQVVLGNSLKPTTVNLTQGGSGGSTNQQIMLGGQTVRLQTSGVPNTHRVVLASQNQGQIITQQFLLPVGFQGTPLNIKNLQGIKVVPLAQTQGKGIPGRSVFARVMNPANIVRVTQAPEPSDVTNLTKPNSE